MTWILVVIEILFALFFSILVFFFQICCSISIKCVGLILIIILYLSHLEYFFVNLGLKYYQLEIIILNFSCYCNKFCIILLNFSHFVVQFQLNV